MQTDRRTRGKVGRLAKIACYCAFLGVMAPLALSLHALAADTAPSGPVSVTFPVTVDGGITSDSISVTFPVTVDGGITSDSISVTFPKTIEGGMASKSISASFGTPVGQWHMDSDWLDSSGNNLDGEPFGGISFTDSGRIESAGVFDGTDGYLNIGTSPILRPPSYFSVEAWIRVASGSTGDMLIAGNFTGGKGYGLSMLDSELLLTIGDGSPYVLSAGVVPQGVWVHAAGTYDGTRLRLYINGKLENEQIVSKNLLYSAPFTIGHGSGYAYFNGEIDEVSVYHRALAADEIWEHYAIGAGIDITPPNQPTVNPVDPVTGNPGITLSGTKDADSSLLINGQVIISINNSTDWTASYTLLSGPNTLNITSKDAFGNESSPPVTVDTVYDNTAPQVKASVPASGSFVNSFDVVDILVEDEYSDVDFAATIDTASVNASDGTGVTGSWQVQGQRMIFTPESQLADGGYTVALSATDTFENSRDYVLTFTLDRQLPEITAFIISPDVDLTADTGTFTVVFSEDVLNTVPVSVRFGMASPYDMFQVSGDWVDDRTWRGTYEFDDTTGDGSYVVAISGAADLAQNVMLPIVAGQFDLDTVSPETPVPDTVESPTNSPVLALTGAKSPDSSIYINGEEVVSLDGLTAWSAEISLTEGENTLNIFSRDRAGNESQPVSITVVLDTQAPAILSSTPADGDSLTEFSSVDIELVDEISGVDIQSSLSGATLTAGGLPVEGNWDVLSGHLVFTPLGAITDGHYAVTLNAVDNLGNSGVVTLGFFVDTAPAMVDNFTMSPDSPHKAEEVTFKVIFSEDMLMSVQPVLGLSMGDSYPSYSVTGGNWLDAKTWQGSFHFLDTTGDGQYFVHLSGALDKAGNEIVSVDIGNFILDTAAPSAPTVNPPDSPTRTAQAELSGMKDVSSVCYVDGNDAGALYTEPHWSYTKVLKEGTNSISVCCADDAGNKSESTTTSIVFDSMAPRLVSSVPSDGASVASLNGVDILLVDDTTSIDFDASIGSAVVEKNGMPVSGTWSVANGHIMFVPSAVIDDGDYVVTLYPSDILGNKSILTLSISVDTGLPSVSTLSMSPQSPHKAETVIFTVTFDEDMDTTEQPEVTFSRGWLYGAYSLTGSWTNRRSWRGTYKFTPETGDGTYTVEVSAAKDTAGNVMADMEAGIFELDTVAPEAPAVNSVLSPTNMPNQTVSGTKPADTAIVINGFQKVPLDGATTWSYSYPLSEGQNILSVMARDAAGNDSPAASAIVILDTTPPAFTIDSYERITNSASQTLTGTKEPGTIVKINGIQICGTDDTDSAWAHTVNLIEGIPNRFTFDASDALGNTRTRSIDILFDISAPAPLGAGVLVADGSGSGTEVNLSWSAYPEPQDVAYYRAYMSSTDFADTTGMSPVGTVDKGVKTYKVGNLTEGITYYFAVIPVDMGGNYDPAVNSVSGIPEDTVSPEDVSIISVKAGYTSTDGNWITVKWEPCSDAAGDLADQLVYFDDGFGYDAGTSLGKAVTEYRWKGLNDDSVYKFKITTRDTNGYESSGSVALGATRLTNPQGLTAIAGNQKVALSWTPVSSQYLKQYNIYRLDSPAQQTDVGTMTLVDTVGSTSYVDTGLVNDRTYQYAITTVNVFGAEMTGVESVAATTRMDETDPEITGFSIDDGDIITDAVEVTAFAYDAESTVDRMEFYVDSVLLETSSGSSLSYLWNIILEQDGNHIIKVSAYDSYGNRTDSLRKVFVSLAPPQTPEIIEHTIVQTTPEYTVNLTGSTTMNTSVVLRVNGVTVSSAQEENASFSFSGILLQEGDNLLAVKSLHRGGESPYSPDYKIIVDTGDPPAPVNLDVHSLAGGLLSLAWDKGVGELPIGYNIYMATSEFTTIMDAHVSKVNSAPLKYTYKEILPPDDILRYYAVTALDSSGNESDISTLISAASDRVAPSLESIDYTYISEDGATVNPVYVAGLGKINVAITVSEPLAEAPFLSFEPLTGSPIVVGLSKLDDSHYEGSFTVNEQSPDSALNYKFSGKDMVGNRGYGEGAGIRLDVSGPVAEITSPLQIQQIVSNPVVIEFVLNENSVITPVLRLVASDGTAAIANSLASSDGINWSGKIDIFDMSEGEAEFTLVTAKDTLGNMGSKIGSGRTILLYKDSVPPPAAPAGLEAKSETGGVVEVAWNPMNDVTSFVLWRRAEGEAEPTKVKEGLLSSSTVDIPPADGTYYYSVSAVGLLENESNRSAEIAVVSDRTGPSAPTDLSLILDGTGVVASWVAPADDTVFGYHLYRLNSPTASIEGMNPIAKVANTKAVDTAPSKTNRYYAVVAVDNLKNEGPPSEIVEIDFPVPPVKNLVLERVDSGSPTLAWQAPAVTIEGYHIYRNGVIITPAPVYVTSYTDGYYAGGSMTYAVSVVDALGNESPKREVVLAPMTVKVAEGTVLRRGLLESIKLDITSGYAELVEIGTIKVKVGTSPESGLSGPFAVGPGQTLRVEKIAATSSDASGTVPVITTVIWEQAPGTSVKITQSSQADVLGSSTALEIFNEPLVRNSEVPVKLKFNNLGSALMEVLTSENNGPTQEVKVNLKDQDGNLLGTGYLNQRTGGVVNIGSIAVARIEPGESFITASIRLPVPESAPNRLVIEAEIGNTYYHYGKADQVTAPGMKMAIEAAIVEVPYRATAAPEQEFYATPQPVVITGQALDSSTGAPVPNVPVKIGISVRGFDRFYSATTDEAGSFSHTFEPGANEAGLYSIWAVYPDVKDRTVQATFAIAGFKLSPNSGRITMGRGRSLDVPVTVSNYGGASLTGLSFATESSEGITATVTNPGDDVLTSGENASVTFTVAASETAPGTGFANMKASVAEGLEAHLNTSITTIELKPTIRVSPSYIDTGMMVGTQKIATFTIKNAGYEVLRNSRLEGLTTQWMSLTVDAVLGDLAPGQSRNIGVMLRPGEDVPQGVYDDKIVVYSDNHIPFTYHVQVTVTGSAVGSVLFDVLNEFYEDVSGASIVFQHQSIYELKYNVSTGTDGTSMVNDIPEGRYVYNVSAPGHLPKSGSFDIMPAMTTTVPIGLQVTLVDIEWSVTPVIIEDRYEITVSQTFATKVPAPVLVIEPAVTNLPRMAPGEVFNGEFKVTNYGLVALNNVKISYPTRMHVYDIEILSETVPTTLGAMQSVTVPFRITKRLDETIQGAFSMFDEVIGYGGGSCGGSSSARVSGDYTVCPNSEQESTGSQSAAHTFTHPPDEGAVCGGTGGSGGMTYGGGGGGGGGGGPSPGASTPIKTENPCENCVQLCVTSCGENGEVCGPETIEVTGDGKFHEFVESPPPPGGVTCQKKPSKLDGASIISSVVDGGGGETSGTLEDGGVILPGTKVEFNAALEGSCNTIILWTLSGDKTLYAYGDGVSHTFNEPGTYKVSLGVTCQACDQGSGSDVITFTVECPECQECKDGGQGCEPIEDGSSCTEDEKWCTDDICENGTCVHPIIQDELSDKWSINIKTFELVDKVDKFFRLLNAQMTVKGQISGEVKKILRCCESSKGLKPTISGSATGAITAEVQIPLYQFNILFAKAKVALTGSGSADGSATVKLNLCDIDDYLEGKLGVQAAAGGGAFIKIAGFVEIGGEVKSGVSGVGTINAAGIVKVSISFDGIWFEGHALLTDGTILGKETTYIYTIMDASPWAAADIDVKSWFKEQ